MKKRFLVLALCIIMCVGIFALSACDSTEQTQEKYDYCFFGEYPQTIKADDVTITETIDSRGYYLGSDNCYYAKVNYLNSWANNYKFSNDKDIKNTVIGETKSGESIYQPTYFKVEPIKWRRYYKNDGVTAMLISNSILLGKDFDNSLNDYADSDIRAWLNGTELKDDEDKYTNYFYANAFSTAEQAKINVTTVDNSLSSTGDTVNKWVCENTEDKVFLLSYSEAINANYNFNADSEYDITRQLKTTDFARAKGAWMDTNSRYYGCGHWLLRTPYNRLKSDSVKYVFSNGSMGDSRFVYGSSFGIVPAITMNKVDAQALLSD